MGKIILMTVLVTFPLLGQSANIAAIGPSFCPSCDQKFAGTALYAREISPQTHTYSFTVLDAVSTLKPPYTVTTNVATGVAQRVGCVKKICAYVPAAAGVSWSGSNTGWSWSTGALVSIPIGSWRIMPSVRVIKSSVSAGSGYQLIGSPLVGMGW